MKTKKELKEEYKQMKIPMGVFQIKSIKNNKVLIDSSVDMESKWKRTFFGTNSRVSGTIIDVINPTLFYTF